MTIDITNQYNGYILAGNPVMMNIYTGDNRDVEIVIVSGSTPVYTGTYTVHGRLQIDISDILQPLVSSDDNYRSSATWYWHNDRGMIAAIRLVMYDTPENKIIASSPTYHILFGGVSKIALRNQGITAYLSRIMSADNFSLSTRSSGRLIGIRETELADIVLFSYGRSIDITSPKGSVITIPASSDSVITTISLHRLRISFMTDYDELPAYLSFSVDHVFCFQVYITPGAITEVRSKLRFRNSLGAYETIEITGKHTVTPSAPSESAEYAEWDPVIMDYVTTSSRAFSPMTIVSHTGYKNTDELQHLLDLMISDDVHYIDASGNRSKVTITADNMQIPLSPLLPTSVALTIKYADQDLYYTPVSFAQPITDLPAEWFLARGVISAAGLLYANSKITTI